EERRSDEAGGEALRSEEWACTDGVDDAAGRAVLLGQLPRWLLHRQGWREVYEVRRALPGDAALSGFAEPACISEHAAEAGRDDALGDGVRVFGAEVVGLCKDEIRGFFLPQPASWPGIPFALLRMTAENFIGSRQQQFAARAFVFGLWR